MRNSSCAEGIGVNDAEVEELTDYIHLGCQLDPNKTLGGEIREKTKSGLDRFQEQSRCANRSGVACECHSCHLQDDRASTNAICLNVWSTAKRDEEKFAVAETAMERRLFGVTRIDRLSSEELRHRTAVNEVDFMQQVEVGRPFARKSDNRWTCRLTDWVPCNWQLALKATYKVKWTTATSLCQRWEQKAQNKSEWNSAGLRQMERSSGKPCK